MRDDISVIIGTIGSDCHIVGSTIIARTLDMSGIKVVQLGACVAQEEFIDAAIETKADVIMVSSMYGMGFFDCDGLRDKCVESGLDDILLYVGGYLSVDNEDDAVITEKFEGIGFDRVYLPGTNPKSVVVDLISDLRQGEA